MAVNGEASFPASLLLVGAGKMGGALLQGWLDSGLDGRRISVVEPQPSSHIASLCEAAGVRLGLPDGPPEALVLATKPQLLHEAAPPLESLAREATLVVSIMAGKRIADIAAALPQARAIVRAMPNLPAAIGEGITGAVANAAVTPAQREGAHRLLAAVGRVEWLAEEAQVDAVTAVSGSGPAYVFYLTECLAAAGRAAGLPDAVAERLARATVEGSGALLAREPGTSPAQLRVNVTSPGGTTAAALEILMAPGGGLAPLVEAAVLSARRRAQELSG
jgi:pyrroline-5-carboxylate reductase